jgi:leucyl-tRNA synthetase
MEEKFNYLEIQDKWQKYWEENGFYEAKDFGEKPKYYILVMFPYPSGSGLHVGHGRNFIPADVAARYKRMQGFNVLHPIGYDAFGLPAENYAIENNVNPKISTENNIRNYRRQLKMLGVSYDWQREFATSDVTYYKWTEWFFELLYKRGLAYQDTSYQWWCPHCKTVLANEQIIDGKCWRCGTPVVKKELKEWFLKITDYGDRLMEDLDKIDWPERIKSMQKNWIGKSVGTEVIFKAVSGNGNSYDIPVFTTRVDTIFGVTFLAIAPEHPLLSHLTAEDRKTDIEKYVEESMKKIEIDRLSQEREKTGLFTGSYAINPLSQEKVPIYVGDYVVYSYGTGAVMGVPAHDERDFTFAKKHNLPIKTVVERESGKANTDGAFTDDGILVNSSNFSGLKSDKAREQITEFLQNRNIGKSVVRYKMRDWLISRQRYWGAPIPIIHCPEHGAVPVPENELPVILPDEVDFTPRETGESPLANDQDFVNTVCPICGKPSKRETDTQDGFACSSWYFLRYADPKNDKKPFDRSKIDYWLPVDLYIGGAEHAVMHLLYARFYTKVMHDAGLIGFDEPFKKLLNQGMILGVDHQKMSKSRGNVVNPDDVIREYGTDTLRAYMLFIGPLESDAQWSTEGINGISRFIKRMWNLFTNCANTDINVNSKQEKDVEIFTDKMVQHITNQIENFKFNTMISSFMEWLNFLQKTHEDFKEIDKTQAYRNALETFTKMIAPATPFVSEELWHRFGHKTSVHLEDWPKPLGLFREEKIIIPIQVNGKLRDRIEVPVDSSEDEVIELAKNALKIKSLNIDFNSAKFIFAKKNALEESVDKSRENDLGLESNNGRIRLLNIVIK